MVMVVCICLCVFVGRWVGVGSVLVVLGSFCAYFCINNNIDIFLSLQLIYIYINKSHNDIQSRTEFVCTYHSKSVHISVPILRTSVECILSRYNMN